MDSVATISPDRLVNLCLRVCTQYPIESLTERTRSECMEVDGCVQSITDEVQSHERYEHNQLELRRDVFFHNIICEPLFDGIVKRYPEHYLRLFTDTNRCSLSKINLSFTNTRYPIQDQQLLSKLFYHPLREINLSRCQVAPTTLNALKYCAGTLKILDLSNVSGLKNNFILKQLKNLEKLNLQSSDIGFRHEHMKNIGHLPLLTWLDISLTSVDDRGIRKLGHCAGTLTWLSLHHCVFLVDEIGMISLFSKLQRLQHLDISRNSSEEVEERNEKNIPSPIVTPAMLSTFAAMPCLKSLDISGAVNLKQEHLLPFSQNGIKLHFLGLCQTDLSYHSNLPANVITGEANEEQILTSLTVYHDRPKYMSFSLRQLFSLACHHNCNQIHRCIHLIIEAMTNFKHNNSIHVAAMATLYHISRVSSVNEDVILRRKLILAILDSMENLKGVLQLQKNACLTLCNFKIPSDVEFAYFRVADLLLAALRAHKDDYLRGIAIMLFNAIVCQNAGNQKKEVGLRGAIQTVMLVIREKVELREVDSLMDTCWSSLWNITDETPENCKDFLDNGGMDLFYDCLRYFPDSLELHRNMMGLMGNVAEVADLRPYLMSEEYIRLFMSLLHTDPNWLEVSYNSVGLLSHILSDGPQAWTLKGMSRDQCMCELIECIEAWDLKSTRNINYRSFKPILGLLACFHAPSAQHWAAWALANLTTVSPDKYCKLVVQEGGIDLLQNIMDTPDVISKTKYLAQMVVSNCQREMRIPQLC